MYLIDTNILLEPFKITNPIDLHPTYWSKLKLILERDDVISIDKVKAELFYLEDELAHWCKVNIPKRFWKLSNACLAEYAEIQNWAQNKHYNQRALLQFADSKNADPFLVAYAKYFKSLDNSEITLVTQEVSNPESKRNIKLPDVCICFGIRYIKINDFFREINASF
jgi:hypothetical protein